jgi:predicted Zn-dependent peptidase
MADNFSADLFLKKAHRTGSDGIKTERKKLKNGITIVTESLPYFPSVTAGIWIKTGSRSERENMNGSSHFVEHLFFKGTKRLSYSDIYKSFDKMGGVLDAFTSREIMGFYFRVQKKHFAEAFSILSEMIVEPVFPKDEVERERSVILEEIKMVNDTPSDVAVDLFMMDAFPKHPLGRPVQGTEASLLKMSREALLKRHKELVSPQNIVLTATGDIDLDSFIKVALEPVSKLKSVSGTAFPKASFHAGTRVYEKDHIEQAQIVIGFDSEPASSPGRFDLLVLGNILGGTMSSRLFTEIREKLGLVYSISSEHIGHQDSGFFGIQAASGHSQAAKTVRETIKVLTDFCAKGPSKEELDIAKENLTGGFILSLESASGRMGRLARNELYFGGQTKIEDAIKGIEKVSSKDILKTARKTFSADKALLTVLGKKSALKGVSLSPLEKKW